ncbi:MAG: alcohol dehydrogenase catalytic domain-containing protein [Anaerolineae bacterium]|nr:alcohol dehydrogenase catalytic domain-containing protein [Anaerolineae bacterium]
MKAVVCHGVGDYRLEEVPMPEVGPGEVLVKVTATGVCASDVKAAHGAARIWGSDVFPRYIQPPVIPGHEFVGTVVALGEGAQERHGVRVGDAAVAEQIVPDWTCRYCRRGQYWMCEQHDIFGFRQRAQGSWAQYMKFPADSIVHKVPQEMPAPVAALIEPLACAIHAVERADIQLGETVVIAGMGPIGLCMLQVARMKSPGMLIGLDVRESRVEVARKLGADLALNPAREDVIAKVMDLTHGYGCDVYIEVTGSPKGVYQGLQMIRKLGRFVEFSVMAEPASVDWSIIGDQKELDVLGAHLGPYCYPNAIRFLQEGSVDGRALVTHTLPLERFQEALELAERGEESLKVVLLP